MKHQLIFITTLLIFATTASGQQLKDTVVDIDNNVYHTVKIGTQTWMAENLAVTHYRNGDNIINVTDSAQWSRLKTGAYCNYNNDTNIAKKYGLLYNWYAVTDIRNIAPKGWHVPTDDEWEKLTDYLGGENEAGYKLKEQDTNHWKSPNDSSTNETGFTALPGGYRYHNGSFGFIGVYGAYWGSNEYDFIEGWSLGMTYSDRTAIILSGTKTNGLTVRCIKD